MKKRNLIPCLLNQRNSTWHPRISGRLLSRFHPRPFRVVILVITALIFSISACQLGAPLPIATDAVIASPEATAKLSFEEPLQLIREVPITVPGDGQERILGSIVMEFQGIPEYCPQFNQYNVRFIWITVPWNIVEPEKGIFNWEFADDFVDSILACEDLELAFRISSYSEWATLPPPPRPVFKRAPASTAPKNPQDYYDFMFNLARHFKGRVTRYAIEEEAHAENVYWGGTPEQYMELLATAYLAVHDADPDAIVQDSGLSSSAVALLYAYDLFTTGKKDEASQFLNAWFEHYAPKLTKGETLEFDTTSDLEYIFAHDQFQRLLTHVDLLWDAYYESYDVQQIHYVGPWNYMPQLLDWIHDSMTLRGSDKPIEFWEFGYGWDDMSTYDPQDHAMTEAKLMAMATGEGVLRSLSWQFTDYASFLGHPGLVTGAGPRPAAVAFGVTAEKVNGTTSSTRMIFGQDVWGYRLIKPSGTVFVLWSAHPVRVTLPVDVGNVIVTDIFGNTYTADPQTLEIGVSPIFVEVP